MRANLTHGFRITRALKSIGATNNITALLLTRLYAVFNIFFLLHIASEKMWRLTYIFPETKRTNGYILPILKMCALPTIRVLNFRVHHTHAVFIESLPSIVVSQ